ncbi:MAG: hypothetical protein JO292_11760 [Betaproteobacteria bacterium]|nr:hypothetical protein [Betaproteobacteria bacterium]
MAYWFRAKRYGWGWGLPLTWQGWVVLAVFLGFLGAGILLLPTNAFIFFGYVGLLSGVLVVICWIKGEPPRWRWGK